MTALPYQYPPESPIVPISRKYSDTASERTVVVEDTDYALSLPPPPPVSILHRPISIHYPYRYPPSPDIHELPVSHVRRHSQAASVRFSPIPTPPPTPPEIPQVIELSANQIYRKSTLSRVRGAQDVEPQDTALDHKGRLWSPWPLRNYTLLALMLFYIGCIGILEILSMLSNRNIGLGIHSEKVRFLWTYLPPLVFFIVASFWGQVEYRTKQLMPWRMMAGAAAPAAQSILMNYITPLNIAALAQSIKYGHPGIAVVILAGGIIKLLIITSTAVLALDEGHVMLQAIPLRIMEALLAVLVLLTGAMILLSPSPATPCDASTIAGLSTILTNSPEYNGVLSGLSTASSDRLEEEVLRHRYQSVVGYKDNEPFFRLAVVSKENDDDSSSEEAPSISLPSQWWSPIHDATRLAVMAVLFGAIVAIELLHQRSQKHQGIMNLEDNSRMLYAWQMIPAIIAVSLFGLVGLVDYATRLIQPYYELKKGTASAERTIQVNYLASLAPGAVLNALRNRHLGVAVTALAVFLAPLLTIITSGLFYTTDLRLASSSSSDAVPATGIRLASTLSANAIRNSSDFVAAANKVIAGNDTNWPSWTSDILVFPSIASTANNTSNASFVVNAEISAMFATLNCSIIPSDNVITWLSSGTVTSSNVATNPTSTTTGTSATSLATTPSSNSITSSSTASSTTLSSTAVPIPRIAIPVSKNCAAPCINDANVNTCNGGSYIYTSFTSSAAGSLFGNMFMSKPSPAPGDWDDTCPQISLAYGRSTSTDSHMDDLVVMTCFPAVMRSSGNATFDMSSGQVILSTINTNVSTSLLSGEKAAIDLNSILDVASTSSTNNFDHVFTALMDGRDPLPSTSLLGADNSGQVREKLETMYARVMAQRLNLDARIDTDNHSSEPVVATITSGASSSLSSSSTTSPPTASRLLQDKASTRILEGLLGAIFLLLAISFVATDTRKVLPYNPCSIARMSTLITDSELLKGIVPPGSEWVGQRQLSKNGVWEMYVFSLGIFEKRSRSGQVLGDRVFGVDTGKAEKVVD